MVDNPQVVKLCNEGVRPAMNMFAGAYYAAKQLIDAYDSGQVAAMLPTETDGEFIGDGSATDGRPQLTAGGLKLIVENTRGLVAQLESTQTESGLSLIQGVLSVAPQYARGA